MTDSQKPKPRAAQQYLNKHGAEKLSPIPLEPPVGFQRTPSLAEQIRSMVKSERLAAEVHAAGAETFEESDDFDVADDPPDPNTAYENEFDPPIIELTKAGEAAMRQKADELAKASKATADIAAEGKQSKPPEPLKGDPPRGG